MRPIRRAAVTGLFALWLAPLGAVTADRAPVAGAEAHSGIYGPERPAAMRDEDREDESEADRAEG
ncbi:hypothetical protein GWK16_07780 [Roseomonas sp. JC162]|uniref:Uncharacterized protein n=1 Tax=Neoroseomonas marina TaxID=1232220 RepID=A0A848E9J9_9PROT|nr:hypothetical protein [Neoroseomonas marina]NMJ41134.1 hypothetical protein [Neoroseomonas marina]